ncbi:MAG: enoyl-CoA hydratase-related protein [Bacteroidota bacterium]|nr:enoyl-CoA hydratase-related protein [Bacteroidota bacterium]
MESTQETSVESQISHYTNILVTEADRIATFIINRPDKLNALSIETIREIKEAAVAASNNANILGVIITGSGNKAFVAGADIAEFSDFNSDEAEAMSRHGHDTFTYIENMSKPVLAAINGFALGGGCELAMACHIRIAATNARFGQPEVNLGLTPGYGGTQRLERLIGRSKATELLLTGDMINAEDALRLGMISQLVEPEALMEKAVEIMGKIAKKAPLAVAKTLSLINSYYDKTEDGFEAEIAAFAASFGTNDFKEGVAAFLEKRKAEFKGN